MQLTISKQFGGTVLLFLLMLQAALAQTVVITPAAGDAGRAVEKVQGQEIPVLNSMRPLLEQTMRDGYGRAWVEGDIADKFNAQLSAKSQQTVSATGAKRVLVGITRLRAIGDKCGHVRMDLSRPGLSFTAKDGQSMPAAFSFEMNICANGSPPPPSLIGQ
jgi:hypothetical protein